MPLLITFAETPCMASVLILLVFVFKIVIFRMPNTLSALLAFDFFRFGLPFRSRPDKCR